MTVLSVLRQPRLVCVVLGSIALVGNVQAQSERSNVSVPPATSRPMDVLRLFEIDRSVIEFLEDGQPLSDGEWETVRRTVYVMGRVDVGTLAAWNQPLPAWDAIVAAPNNYRLNVYRLAGHLRRIERRSVPDEIANRFGYRALYQLQIETLEGPTATVFTHTVPQDWEVGFDLSNSAQAAVSVEVPVSCSGLLLKVGPRHSGDSVTLHQLIFVAPRIAWHPNQRIPQLGVSLGKAELGTMGMDVGLLDNLQQRAGLTRNDREAFYQLLWCVGRTVNETQPASQPLDIVTAIQHPRSLAGQRFRLQGLARRALWIRVDDVDVRERYGFDGYYEVEFFAPLAKPLSLIPADAKSEQQSAPRLFDRYPMTLCCRSLPAGMSTGDQIRQPMRVEAYFFKLRTYESGGVRTPRETQLSPLLISYSCELVEADPSTNSWTEWSVVGLVLGGSLLAGIAGWLYRRGDRDFAQLKRARREGQPESLRDLE